MPHPNDTASHFRDVPLKDLLTTAQAAKITGHTMETLNQYRSWRRQGRPTNGPEFVKVGKSVFYTRSALQRYMARRA